MENLNHPHKEEICQYIAKELPEDKEMALGEHLAVCLECRIVARNTFKNKIFWDDWTARQHGQAYWKKRITESITQVTSSAVTADLKGRLLNWLNNWGEKTGGLIEVVLNEAQKACRVITDSIPTLLVPQHSWCFIYDTVIRGIKEEADCIKVISRERPQIQVITDTANKKVIIQIEESKNLPPLVILVPRNGASILAQPKKISGTKFYAAYFEGLSVGEYALIFEPQKGE